MKKKIGRKKKRSLSLGNKRIVSPFFSSIILSLSLFLSRQSASSLGYRKGGKRRRRRRETERREEGRCINTFSKERERKKKGPNAMRAAGVVASQAPSSNTIIVAEKHVGGRTKPPLVVESGERRNARRSGGLERTSEGKKEEGGWNRRRRIYERALLRGHVRDPAAASGASSMGSTKCKYPRRFTIFRLDRRRPGQSSATPRNEEDSCEILSSWFLTW